MVKQIYWQLYKYAVVLKFFHAFLDWQKQTQHAIKAQEKRNGKLLDKYFKLSTPIWKITCSAQDESKSGFSCVISFQKINQTNKNQ